jgi:hypothetical protein
MSDIPTVINCKKVNLIKLGYKDLQDWLSKPNHMYIGRDMIFYVPGAIGSKWANKFHVKMGRDKCLELYEADIRSNNELMNSLHELKGKTLACWCDPLKCHGHILVKLYKEKFNTSQAR